MMDEGKRQKAGRSGCVRIEFHGHSCISIRWKDLTIVIDPHDGGSIGLARPNVKADVVLVTHNHFDHNAVEVVSHERTIVVQELVGEKHVVVGEHRFSVSGYRVPHDREGGKRRGMTSAYKLSLDAITLVHLGDIGAIPDSSVLESLATPRPDVLFIPVGGVYTIEPYEAWELVEKINPCYAVPMHYWVPGCMLPLYPVHDFILLARTGRIEVEGEFTYCGGACENAKSKILFFKRMATLEVTKEELPYTNEAVST